MKKNLKIIFFSILIGTTLATLFFLNIKEKALAKNKNMIYIFQVGVFKQIENALNEQNKYLNSKIIKDNLYYRVLIGSTIKNKELLKKHYENLKYNYYLKEIEVSEEVIDMISKFDELLSNTDNIDLVIKNTLEVLPYEL